jgi:hypothetical protein
MLAVAAFEATQEVVRLIDTMAVSAAHPRPSLLALSLSALA